MIVLRLLLLIILFTSVSSAFQIENSDVLEFVRKIGENSENEEFLLVKPQDVKVDNNNRIYVIDERRIKVFDSSGGEYAIIGGPGQGPGEFQRPLGLYMNIGPEGYITAWDMYYFNLYDSNYNFLKRLYTFKREAGISFTVPRSVPRVISINEDEHYISNFTFYRDDDLNKAYIRLFYISDSDTVHIAEYDEINGVISDNRVATLLICGKLIWDILPDGTLFYTHTGADEKMYKGKHYLTLHFYRKPGEEYTIDIEYSPVRITEERYEYLINSGGFQGGSKFRDLHKEAKKRFLKNYKYEEPFINILVDNNTLFLQTRDRYDFNDFSITVFDLKSRKRNEFSFPISLTRRVIKNGFLYEYDRGNADTLPGVYIYKINPEVYIF
ncbi:6-bladed beta-propeller [candidate division KSB1 bacterium]